MSHSPYLSIVVVNYKGTDQLETCLEHLYSSDLDLSTVEIVVCDVLTRELSFMKSRFPGVKFVHLSHDPGPSKQHNIGEENCNPSSKYLLLMDNDVFVDKTAVRSLLEAAAKLPSETVVQPLILNSPTGNVQTVQSAGNQLDQWLFSGARLESGSDGDNDFFYASGACYLVSHDFFARVGKYDPEIRINSDDLDFGWRCRLFGGSTYLVKAARVIHAQNSLSSFSPNRYKHFSYGIIRSFLKNYEMISILRYSLGLLATRFGLTIRFAISRRNPTYFKLFFEAMIEVVITFPEILEGRRYVQARRAVSDEKIVSLMYRGSYFLERVRRK